MKRPLILISNDDGYSVKGIHFLVDIARRYGDVVVVAPDGARSGSSMSVTFSSVVKANLIKEEEGLKVYSCTGTPGDCVKLGIAKFCDRTPDLVLAGINHGDNSAVNVHYSGTMGVVKEGCLKGISSIGFSHFSHSMETDFNPMKPYIEKIISHVLENKLPIGVCLNVNAPDIPKYAGLKVCTMGEGVWQNEWEERISPRGFTYYWLVGDFKSVDKQDDNTDRNAMKRGYIAVTPVKINVTAFEAINNLSSLEQ